MRSWMISRTKKCFGSDEEIDDRKRFEIVIHEKQVWIVTCGQPLALGLECAIDNARAELPLLTLELKLLIAGRAIEIRKRAVVREG